MIEKGVDKFIGLIEKSQAEKNVGDKFKSFYIFCGVFSMSSLFFCGGAVHRNTRLGRCRVGIN